MNMMCWPDLGSEPQELAITRKWGKGEIGKQGSTIVRTVELHYPPPLSKFFQKLQSDANLQSTESKRCCPVSDSYWVKPKTYIVDIPKGKSYIDATALLLSLLETCQEAILFCHLLATTKTIIQYRSDTQKNINGNNLLSYSSLLSRISTCVYRFFRTKRKMKFAIQVHGCHDQMCQLTLISSNWNKMCLKWEYITIIHKLECWIYNRHKLRMDFIHWSSKPSAVCLNTQKHTEIIWYFKISLKFTLCISKHAWASPAFHAYVHDTKMWTVWYDSHSQYRDTSSSPRFHCFQQRLTIAKNRV